MACIGNILNPENIAAFQQSNVAIGMRISPLFRCHRCNGRVNCVRTGDNKINKQYTPSKLEKLSEALNRLSTTFVFDANTNITCFFPVFREARRLRNATEHALFMILSLTGFVCLTLILCLIFGFSVPYMDDLQTLYILVLSIPLSTISCLARPTDNSNMKVHVVSPKYIQYMQSTVVMIKGAVIKVIVSSLIMLSIHIL